LVLAVLSPVFAEGYDPAISLLDPNAPVNFDLERVFNADISKSDMTKAITNNKLLSDTTRQVQRERGSTNVSGFCLSGVKRALGKALSWDFFDNTVSAADYLLKLKSAEQFNEIKCDRSRIDEYPNGVVFVLDRKPNCAPDGVLKNNSSAKCSYHGHIMIKISSREEFDATIRPLTKWSPYFGDDCWAFLLADVPIPEADEDDKAPDLCFLDPYNAKHEIIIIPKTGMENIRVPERAQ
jgi:hypothetical protein